MVTFLSAGARRRGNQFNSPGLSDWVNRVCYHITTDFPWPLAAGRFTLRKAGVWVVIWHMCLSVNFNCH